MISAPIIKSSVWHKFEQLVGRNSHVILALYIISTVHIFSVCFCVLRSVILSKVPSGVCRGFGPLISRQSRWRTYETCKFSHARAQWQFKLLTISHRFISSKFFHLLVSLHELLSYFLLFPLCTNTSETLFHYSD